MIPLFITSCVAFKFKSSAEIALPIPKELGRTVEITPPNLFKMLAALNVAD